MKDFAKVIAAIGFLSILIAYGGRGGHDTKAEQSTDAMIVQTADAMTVNTSEAEIANGAEAKSLNGAEAETVNDAEAETVSTPPNVPPVQAPLQMAASAPAPRAVEGKAVSKPVAKRFTIYFGFDSAKMPAAARKTLREAIAFAKSIDAKHIALAGHADRAGPSGYNVKLSERRARAVASALGAIDLGQRKLEVAALGERNLAVPTPDGAAEPRNRRVEIVISA